MTNDCKHKNITLDDYFVEDGELYFAHYCNGSEKIYSIKELKEMGYKLVRDDEKKAD